MNLRIIGILLLFTLLNFLIAPNWSSEKSQIFPILYYLEKKWGIKNWSMGYEEMAIRVKNKYILFNINCFKYYTKNWQTFSVKG